MRGPFENTNEYLNQRKQIFQDRRVFKKGAKNDITRVRNSEGGCKGLC